MRPEVTLAALRAAVARAVKAALAAGEKASDRRLAEASLRRADDPAAAGALIGAVDEYEQALADFRAVIDLTEALLTVLEHDVRGSLAVVKGRAQLLRRHAVRAPQPDARLVRGLSEIDEAVDRLVARLDGRLPPTGAIGSAGEPPEPPAPR